MLSASGKKESCESESSMQNFDICWAHSCEWVSVKLKWKYLCFSSFFSYFEEYDGPIKLEGFAKVRKRVREEVQYWREEKKNRFPMQKFSWNNQ